MFLEIILLASIAFPEYLREMFGLIVDLLQLFSVASPTFLICALDIISFTVWDILLPIKDFLLLCAVRIYRSLVQPVYLFCSKTLCPFANSVPTVWLSSALRASIGHSSSIFNSASIVSMQLLDCSVAMVASSTRNLLKLLRPIAPIMKEYAWKAALVITVSCIIIVRLIEIIWDALHIICIAITTTEGPYPRGDSAHCGALSAPNPMSSLALPVDSNTLSAVVHQRDVLSATCAKLELKCIWLREECESLQRDNDALDAQNQRLVDDYGWATRFIQRLVVANARAGRDPETYALYMLFEDGTREYANAIDAGGQESEDGKPAERGTSSSSPTSSTSSTSASSPPTPAIHSEPPSSPIPPSTGCSEKPFSRSRILRRAGPSISSHCHSRSSSSESSKSSKSNSSQSSTTTLVNSDNLRPSPPPMLSPSEKLAAARMASPFVREFLARSCASPHPLDISPTAAVYCS